ncbi:hypothetical protein FRX31_012820 [Thalictrum thalictroides]|uniref:Uncharacterized protein n=1 Tax=Thalictrum thalictroides TaxID=46969 RepID=A0A7J6WKW0_THATH|nr:hypothetical protein FRX31_012820 [Thalictrum thalictroides]
MLVQPVSQVISNSNHDAIAPEISCLATQIPNTIATSILGDQGQLGVGVHAAQGSQVASSNQQGTTNAGNHTPSTDGVEASWSSIMGRQAMSKKNLPFYVPTIVEGATIRIDVENDEKETDKEEQTRSEVNKSLDKEQIKGKGIEIQVDCQGEGKSGKKRDGFMKDARQAIGAHGTGRGTTRVSNANKKINAGQVKNGGKGNHITGITYAGNGGHTKGR